MPNNDERVPVRPIAKTAPEAEQQIFVHREGIDVADPASFEVAGAGMMHGVGAAPEVIGRQRHHADHPTHPIVRQAMAEIRTMAAIVLNHEQSHKKTRSRYSKYQGEPPVAEMQRCPGQRPERCKRHERDHNLYCAADVIGFAVAREDLRPAPHVGRQ